MPPPPSRNPSLSPYQQFVQEWGNGCGSDLCAKANKICLARGSVPADIVIIGEASGESENIVGRPFCGPAGRLLDRILDNSIDSYNQELASKGKPPLRYAITNLVCCLPRGEDGLKATEPDPEDIQMCKPRLEYFLELCDPDMIICVGRLASQHLKQGYRHSVRLVDKDTPIVDIVHPAWALRQNKLLQDSYERKATIIVSSALSEVFGENS